MDFRTQLYAPPSLGLQLPPLWMPQLTLPALRLHFLFWAENLHILSLLQLLIHSYRKRLGYRCGVYSRLRQVVSQPLNVLLESKGLFPA